MKIAFTSLHHIDHSASLVKEIDIKDQGTVLDNYVEKLLDEILESPKKKLYVFQRDTTEIRSAIELFLNKEYEAASKIIVERLLPIEKDVQRKVAHMGVEIQKGSLFQAIVEGKKENHIIISKADHDEFVDESDFLIHKGLPWKKKVYKALVASISPDNSIESVFIYDTNAVISRYWWDSYFELKPLYTDEYNTKKSLEFLDKKIFNPIKKKYPADHQILRNSTIGYFRNKDEFDVTVYTEEVFDKYTPVDSKLPLKKIKKDVIDLPNKWKFDNRFEISKKDISKKAVYKVSLENDVDLILRDYIKSEDFIEAIEDNEGEKYIKIKTKIGYERFKR